MRLKHSEIHVWSIHQKTMGNFEISKAVQLSAREVSRALRFKNCRQGRWWAYIHVAVRKILGQYLSQPAAEIDFTESKYGKPSLVNISQSSLHFNLSHSGGCALFALANFSPIGVDLEVKVGLKDISSVVHRFFSPLEQQQFHQLPKALQLKSFYNIWTCKEALIKSNGLGLSAPLNAFDVPIGNFTDWRAPIVRAPLDSFGQYRLMKLAPASNYAAALCLHLQDAQCVELPKVCEFNYRND